MALTNQQMDQIKTRLDSGEMFVLIKRDYPEETFKGMRQQLFDYFTADVMNPLINSDRAMRFIVGGQDLTNEAWATHDIIQLTINRMNNRITALSTYL